MLVWLFLVVLSAAAHGAFDVKAGMDGQAFEDAMAADFLRELSEAANEESLVAPTEVHNLSPSTPSNAQPGSGSNPQEKIGKAQQSQKSILTGESRENTPFLVLL